MGKETCNLKDDRMTRFKSLYATVGATAMTAAQVVAAGDRTLDLLVLKLACQRLGHPATTSER